MNVYGGPKIERNIPLEEFMLEEMDQSPIILDQDQRKATESAVVEVCKNRGYVLHAVNARTNHVHSVVSAQMTGKDHRFVQGLFNTKVQRRLAYSPRPANLVAR